mmetsp:Transcript_2022/g.5168  ORF Transcript_2022/g.5168 Transcript_2022/m.5168 type:complete len:275 (+) Transcript_2022:1528-2352(+)
MAPPFSEAASSASLITPRRRACWCASARNSTQTCDGYVRSTSSTTGTSPIVKRGGHRDPESPDFDFFDDFLGRGWFTSARSMYASTYRRLARIVSTTLSMRNVEDRGTYPPATRLSSSRSATAPNANRHQIFAPPGDWTATSGRMCACGARLASRSMRSAVAYTARRCDDVNVAPTESIRRWIRCADILESSLGSFLPRRSYTAWALTGFNRYCRVVAWWMATGLGLIRTVAGGVCVLVSEPTPGSIAATRSSGDTFSHRSEPAGLTDAAPTSK